MKRITLQDFIDRARMTHNDAGYDYSKVTGLPNGMHSRITIGCRKHGDFEMKACNHVTAKQGCPKCGVERRATAQYDTKESFIEKARSVHGDRYDYGRVIYVSSKEKVEIFCRQHNGSFWQKPNVHLSGNQCGICRPQAKMTTETFIAKARRKHANDQYDYSKVSYFNSQTRVIITCTKPGHGDFKQDPSNHLAGAGCPKCGLEIRSAKHNLTTEEFIERALAVHGDHYDYSVTEYRKRRDTVDILCREHGKFRIRADDHLGGYGCKKCRDNISTGEKELRRFIESLGYRPEYGRRNLLGTGKELDIYIPEKSFAIEYNGLFWHSEQSDRHKKGKSRRYHLEKTEAAERAGIRLIQIFEDEWAHKRPIVESRLKHMLGHREEIRYARKLRISHVPKKECVVFLNEHHIQGNAIGASVMLGLYDADTLVAVMTFGQGRYDSDAMELYRFASQGAVVGGFSRLFSAFVREHPEVTQVISYADRRWSRGEVYANNGFVLDSYSDPGYFWCKHTYRYHRQAFQKHKLSGILKNFDLEKTEVENCQANGYFRVFDCGQSKWVWRKE